MDAWRRLLNSQSVLEQIQFFIDVWDDGEATIATKRPEFARCVVPAKRRTQGVARSTGRFSGAFLSEVPRMRRTAAMTEQPAAMAELTFP
jgi:hypothetical protein